MIRSRLMPAALALIVATAACSDDDNGTGPAPENPIDALVGSYSTQSFKYTANDNPELTVDLALIPPGLGITELQVTADGRFVGKAALEIDGQFQEIDAVGTLSDVSETSLTMNFEGIAALVLPTPLTVDYSVVGNVVSFEAEDINFDYSLVVEGAGELPSKLEVVLLKS